MLHEKIDELKHDIIAYAKHVEEMLLKSMDGLVSKNEKELTTVIEVDEPVANERELLIDDACITLIAQYEPRAVDLRNILMILKINNDLERMGDHAENISESALYLIKRAPVKPLIDLPRMSEIVIAMMNRCVTAFVESNAEEADAICLEDDKVDQLRDQILRELVTYMSADPSTIKRSIHLLRIGTNLERVADLITNICEDIIFTVEGRVAKHRHDSN
jgi:phosphate transport system protein